MSLYETLIRQGAWWDLVDEVAIRLVGRVLRGYRTKVCSLIDGWTDDLDLWIRRTAILTQVGHQGATDHRRLLRYCRRRAGDTEFFMQKAPAGPYATTPTQPRDWFSDS